MKNGEERFHQRERFDRKSLKRPDEFISVSHRVLKWVADHRTWFFSTLGALLLLAVAIYGYFYWAAQREEKAFGAYDAIVEDLDDVRSIKIRILQETEMKADDRRKEEEKLAALQQGLEEKFVKFKEDFGGSNAADFALLDEGMYRLREGKYSEAAHLYESALNKRMPAMLADFSALNLGLALEADGRGDESLGAFQKGGKSTYPFIRAAALWGEARVLETLGRKEEARALYDRVASEYPSTPFERKSELLKELQESK